MSSPTYNPPAPSPYTSAGLFDSWVEAWESAVKGAGECLAAALTRGPWSLDVPRWVQVSTDRGRPAWTTPHEIVFDAPIARLRDFSTASSRSKVVPTLVLPPQAGHDSCIVDYSAEQSQMGAILDAGLKRAFSLDWKGATAETADATIDDYLEVIDQSIDHAGGRVNLIGDCQGGWLAAMYAAIHPERVNTLTIAGA